MNLKALGLLFLLGSFSSNMTCAAKDVQSPVQTEVQTAPNNLVSSDSFFVNEASDFDDIDADELLADLQAFEAENPQPDIPLGDKVKLAWEYIKIKAIERKSCILGTSVIGITVVIALYLAYKCYKNKNTNPAV